MVPVSSKSSGKENLGPITQPELPESLITLFFKKKLSLLPNEERFNDRLGRQLELAMSGKENQMFISPRKSCRRPFGSFLLANHLRHTGSMD